jgi:outer membrane protein assembly factor BamB
LETLIKSEFLTMSHTVNASFTVFLTRLRNAVAGLIALAFLISGCQTPPSDQSQVDETTASIHRIAGVPAEMLEKADLHLEWTSQLPMDRAQAIQRIFHHNGRLYAINDRNRLIALDGDKGTVIWFQDLGPSHLPCSTAQFYQDSLLFMVGQIFVQVRETDGMILKQLELDIPVSTSAARSEDCIYVGSNSNRFHALRATDGISLWHNISSEEPTGAVSISHNAVFFVTRDNALYVSMLKQRQLLWDFQTKGMLSGAVVDGDQCFLPSGDTALYCLDPDKGNLIWKYLAGGSLLELPVLTENHVYQPVDQQSLLCLDRYPDTQEGFVRWELRNGMCMLAENGTVSYAMTLNKELTLMNNLTGKPTLSFYVQNMDLYAQNNESPTIFMAAKSGAIVALKPNRIETPPPAPVETTPTEAVESAEMEFIESEE